MGAGASTLPPTEQQTLQKQQMQLSEKAGVSHMGASEREHFEQKLKELYDAHGGNQIFQESSERQKEILQNLERETEKLKELALENNFRKRRLSYSVDPRHLLAIADGALDGLATGQSQPRRPSQEFRSPPFLSAPPLAANRSNRRLKVKPSDEGGASPGAAVGAFGFGTTVSPLSSKGPNNGGQQSGTGATNGTAPNAPAPEPPFDEKTLGTYSHHGIEPKYYGEGFTSKINQDRGCVAHPYVDSETKSLFCVFDGHGERGDEVSEFVLEHVVGRLECDPDLEKDPRKALVNTFLATDANLAKSDIDSYFSGTTAVVVYRTGNDVYTANAGDSRAVLAQKRGGLPGGDKANGNKTNNGAQGAPQGRRPGSLVAVPLSIDQNPDTPGERQRIENAGGFVSDPPGEGLSARVWLDRNMTRVGLAMARSIGDNAVKKVGVIAEPEVRKHVVTEADQFMIIASDGVWEFISSEDAVDAVQASLETTNSASAACKTLIDLAIQCWKDNEGDYRDDITAIVMRLAPYNPAS